MEYKDMENCVLDIAKSKRRKKPGGGQIRYRRQRQLQKEAFKKWQQSKYDEDKEVYMVSKNEYKKAVLLRKKKHVRNYTKRQTLQKEIR